MERADVKETAKTVRRHACKLHQGNYRLFIHPETKPEKQAEKKLTATSVTPISECSVGLYYNHPIIAIRTEKVQVMPEREAEGRY